MSETTTGEERQSRHSGFGSRLKRLALRATVFEVLGFGASQVLRLGSNIILSRLFYPEAFGLLAITGIINNGLIMLSDVGIEQSVIQNKRGDEPAFLNTAWTMQVVRGLGLWLLASLMAWPLAQVYEEPDLMWLLPLGALNIAILGFHSTAIYSLRRRVRSGTLSMIELGAHALGVAIMLGIAYFDRSLWVLVVGGLGFAIFKTVASWMIDMGYRNRFGWDPSAKEAIVHFGKWIFGSSALTFVSRQIDRLLLGRLLGMATLGVYSIALFLSEAVALVLTRVTHGVFFPVFSEVHRTDASRLRNVFYRTRLYMDLVALTAMGGLAALSQWVVDLLYDDRYSDAGWILQALTVRVAMQCILTPMETCLFSMGQTRFGFYMNLARSIWVVIGMPLATTVWGVQGTVAVVALSELPVLLVLWPAFRSVGMLRLRRELFAPAIFAGGYLLGTGAHEVLVALGLG